MKTPLDLEMTPYDELFQTPHSLAEAKREKVADIDISELHDFPEHPFQVRDDSEMDDMVESIKRAGVITPIIVRPRKDGGYEIIAGHRRKHASELVGITTIPTLIRNYDDNEAVIQMIDTNLQRETILPSEKAKAYKMKLEAIKRQAGRPSKENSDQVGQNFSIEIVASNSDDSKTQVQRYIRLNNLIPEILEMVDEKKIAFNPAVELSFLPEKEQRNLLETMQTEDSTPSLSQAQRIKQMSKDNQLNIDTVFSILTEIKPNQSEHIKLKKDTIEKYFPKSYSVKQMTETIINLLEQWQRKRERDRDSR